MKPRKDQTEEQRIMRDMGALIIAKLPEGADKSLALRMFWRKYPYGYATWNRSIAQPFVSPEKTGTVIKPTKKNLMRLSP